MTIKQFIEKAIEGGWKKKPTFKVLSADRFKAQYISDDGGRFEEAPEVPLLDPLAWQAVGKVEGWTTEYTMYFVPHSKDIPPLARGHNRVSESQYNMHAMIDALAEGKTIESFIETL